jgi:peptidoglycan/LPS O-acetylase OafA/YrhL
MPQKTAVTKTTPRTLAGLDHLRAVAILLVLLFHYRLFNRPDWIVSAGVFGWTGVDLFFVLSGYLIASQLFEKARAGKNISMGEFYIKRSFRILPAYAATLLLYFLVPTFKEVDGLSPLWKFVTFTQNFGLDQRYYRAFSHCWSLCVEEQFYLVLPLLMISMHFFKVGAKAFLIIPILFVAGFAIRIWAWNHYIAPVTPGTPEFTIAWTKQMYYPTHTRLDGLLVGVAVAALTVFRPVFTKRLLQYGNLLLLASFALIAVAYVVCEARQSFTGSVFGFPMVSLAYGVLVLAAISPTCILYKFKSRITSSIAILSYSIYLTHKGIFHLVQNGFGKLGVAGNSNLMIVICVAFAILGALVMRYAVEKPFLRIRERILEKRREKQLALTVKIITVEENAVLK